MRQTQLNFALTLLAPDNRAIWEDQRSVLRKRFWQLLGDLPPLFTPQATLINRTEHATHVDEHFMFENGAGASVYGHLLLPHGAQAAPAVVYLHAHGGKYERGKAEVFLERVAGQVPAEVLVAAGYVVLCIDAYCFGERQQHGPAGTQETGRDTEQALFKHFLWQGMTLWGMIVRDDLLALNYLLTRPEVDPLRVGVTGMSLGASRATWLGAMDDRPRVIVPVAQLTRYRDFAEAGLYNGHSVYYYVPNVLKTDLDMEHLTALIAPRRQAVLIGDADPLSPVVGVHKTLDYARQVYALYDAGDQLSASIEAGIDHQYTPSMFEAMLNTLNAVLLKN